MFFLILDNKAASSARSNTLRGWPHSIYLRIPFNIILWPCTISASKQAQVQSSNPYQREIRWNKLDPFVWCHILASLSRNKECRTSHRQRFAAVSRAAIQRYGQTRAIPTTKVTPYNRSTSRRPAQFRALFKSRSRSPFVV